MNYQLAALAQAQTDGSGAGPNQFAVLMTFLLPLGVFAMIIWRAQRRERQKTSDMLGNIKKNDRVMTIGGVIGTVVAVKENEIVIKVDESTNTRMTFIKRAIQQVLTKDGEPTTQKA